VRWLNDYCRQIGLAPRWLAVLFGLDAIMRAHYEKSAVVELRSEAMLVHGMPRTVSATTVDDTMMDRGHFRSQLRYYLENLDDFAPAHKFGPGKGLDILVLTPSCLIHRPIRAAHAPYSTGCSISQRAQSVSWSLSRCREQGASPSLKAGVKYTGCLTTTRRFFRLEAVAQAGTGSSWGCSTPLAACW
jgi:hypothetical protein